MTVRVTQFSYDGLILHLNEFTVSFVRLTIHTNVVSTVIS
jgi:hypothetical protein